LISNNSSITSLFTNPFLIKSDLKNKRSATKVPEKFLMEKSVCGGMMDMVDELIEKSWCPTVTLHAPPTA